MTGANTVYVTRATGLDDLRTVRPLVEAHVAYERSPATVPVDWAQKVEPFVTTDLSTWTGDAFGHLECLFVAEPHRGDGVGRLLIEAAARDVRTRGLRELQWQTPDWNTGAIRFYDRLGATHQTKERFTLRLE